MTILYYPAIIEESQGEFFVSFPDIDGCTSYGKTIQEAALNAEIGLAGHIALMNDDGLAIPKPSNLDDIPYYDDEPEAARILVRTDVPGINRRVNIIMDEGLLARIDKITNNRSAWLSALAKQALSHI